jgi:hypothetical protein
MEERKYSLLCTRIRQGPGGTDLTRKQRCGASFVKESQISPQSFQIDTQEAVDDTGRDALATGDHRQRLVAVSKLALSNAPQKLTDFVWVTASKADAVNREQPLHNFVHPEPSEPWR